MATPASITTTNLLLRGLIPSFLGCPVDKTGISGPFQMTWRKDLESKGADDGACVVYSWVLLCLFMCFVMIFYLCNVAMYCICLIIFVERLMICAVVFLMCKQQDGL